MSRILHAKPLPAAIGVESVYRNSPFEGIKTLRRLKPCFGYLSEGSEELSFEVIHNKTAHMSFDGLLCSSLSQHMICCRELPEGV